MKLAIAQMGFGAILFGEFTASNFLPSPWSLTWFWLFFISMALVGLAVLGCGIAQYLKARRA